MKVSMSSRSIQMFRQHLIGQHHYVEEWGFDWLTTPGAVDWLTKVAAEMASTRTERRSLN
jgi:hypothetical protein